MPIVRYIAVSVLILAAAMVLVFGPRPAPALPPGRENDVIVQYWEKWTDPEASQMRQIVDDFNRSVGAEKHITVQYLSMTNIDQKTLVAISAGVPPDIAGMWDANIAQYGALGSLEPLDDLAAAAGITADYYKPVYWKGCHYDGHLYGLISTPAAVALHWNTRIFSANADVLRAHGCDPDQPPKTLADLDRYAQALETFSLGVDGKKHLERAGYLPMEPGWYVNLTPYWFGGDVWDPATKKFTFTDPRVIAALKWVQSYSDRLGQDAVAEFSSSTGGFNTPQNAFVTGQVVMEQQGPWMANILHSLKPEMDHDWAAAPFPAADPALKDVSFCGFDILSIPKGAKHKQEAFDFIAFVNTQAEMEKLCSLHSKNSPLAKVSPEFIKNHPNPYIGVFEELAASPNAHGPMDCPVATEVGGELMSCIQAISAETATVPERMAYMQDFATRSYQRFLDTQEAYRRAAAK